MRKKVAISLFCTFLMFFCIATSASAGSYWSEGDYSGIYYEVYGNLTSKSFSATIGYGDRAKQLKIGTTLHTNYKGTPKTLATIYSSGYGTVGSNGDSPQGVSKVDYKYYISGVNVASKALTP